MLKTKATTNNIHSALTSPQEKSKDKKAYDKRQNFMLKNSINSNVLE